jgi:hypothetical protein
MGGGLPNLRGKTGRNPLDLINRKKESMKTLPTLT